MNKGNRLLLISLIVFAAFVVLLYLHATRSPAGGPSSGGQGGPPLLLYCAAGIKPPVLEAAQKYEKDCGVQVQIQYGGSGTLLSNLQVARTGDLYLSADRSYQEIARQKEVVREILPVAMMKPVIAVRKGNPKGIAALGDLLKPDVRLSLGNPEAASIGKQTRTILEKAGLWQRVKEHVEKKGVFKPTVNDVASDVQIGAVDAAVVWDSTVPQYPDLEAIEVPEFSAEDKEVGVGVLEFSKQPTEALRFARYLNSAVANGIFRRHGYRAVEGDAWAERPGLVFFCGSVNRRAVEDVVKAFEEREGVTVNAVYNGCGILTAQMRTLRKDEEGVGFPDIYMACDRYYLDNVADWFQGDVDVSETPIVIAVPKGNPKGLKTLKDLAQPGVRVAVGQPDQCTIGALTRILLEKEGVLEGVMKNVLMQTASSAMLVPTVSTGSVDACLAYRTDTRAEAAKVDTIPIDSPHAKAIQPVAISRSGPYRHLSRRLMDDIVKAREQFEAAGFEYRLGK